MAKILNIFAGVGGNSLNWSGHEVTAVENEEKIANIYKKVNSTHEVIVCDAYQYLK